MSGWMQVKSRGQGLAHNEPSKYRWVVGNRTRAAVPEGRRWLAQDGSSRHGEKWMDWPRCDSEG